jgi:hypothetical protein
MRDADPDAVAVIARRRDRQPTQGGGVQPDHGVDGTGARIPGLRTMRRNADLLAHVIALSRFT